MWLATDCSSSVLPRIRRAGARQRRLQNLPCGTDDAPVEAGDGNPGAGLGNGVLRPGGKFSILPEHRIDLRGRLHVGPVVDELLDGNPRRELGKAADVIAVVVRRNQVIDLREPGVLDGRHDAVGVADSGGARVPGINQDRLA
jgi:hypothetical protein